MNRLNRLAFWESALTILLLSVALFSVSGCMPPGMNPGAAHPGQPVQPFEFIFNTVWYILLIVLVYYLMVTRPAALKDEQEKTFLQSLKRNDEVVTSGGIFGRVIGVKPDSITVEIAPNVRIRVLPGNVSRPPAGSSASVVSGTSGSPGTTS